MARKDDIFKFNLLPKKSREEEIITEERDVSIIYSTLLVFGAVFIYLILNIVQLLFVQSRLDNVNTDISASDNTISEYFSIRRINGELVSKSRLLQEPLEEDIKISNFLRLANTLIGVYGEISNYDRESTGTFVITAKFNNTISIESAIVTAKESTEVENVFLRSIATQQDGSYIGKIAFDIIKEDQLEQQ